MIGGIERNLTVRWIRFAAFTARFTSSKASSFLPCAPTIVLQEIMFNCY
jgi:hypothetical protein